LPQHVLADEPQRKLSFFLRVLSSAGCSGLSPGRFITRKRKGLCFYLRTALFSVLKSAMAKRSVCTNERVNSRSQEGRRPDTYSSRMVSATAPVIQCSIPSRCFPSTTMKRTSRGSSLDLIRTSTRLHTSLKALRQSPLLVGPAVVVDARSKEPDGAITWDDIGSQSEQLGPETILLICTGWSQRWCRGDCMKRPHLAEDAARKIIERGSGSTRLTLRRHMLVIGCFVPVARFCRRS
jgi:hypothetical protein